MGRKGHQGDTGVLPWSYHGLTKFFSHFFWRRRDE